jgi:hypothetical protein
MLKYFITLELSGKENHAVPNISQAFVLRASSSTCPMLPLSIDPIQ